MSETPKTRTELENYLGEMTRRHGPVSALEAIEACGLRIVPVDPTQEMIEASGYGGLDHIDEAIADAIAASPFAPEEQTP